MGMLDDLGAYVDTNTSLTLGTDLFLGLMVDNVANCVALYEEGGTTGMYTQGSSNLPKFERPQLQLIVRNTSYSTGRSLADTVYRLLTQVANQTINGTKYLRIEALGTPSVMERDANRRVLFVCNFDVVREVV